MTTPFVMWQAVIYTEGRTLEEPGTPTFLPGLYPTNREAMVAALAAMDSVPHAHSAAARRVVLPK